MGILRVLFVWLLVGVSQMSPLQFVQFVAAIIATVYGVLQTWFLVRDRMRRREPPAEG
jgi:hypothetical protein